MLRLSVKFKRILMPFAVERHQRNSIHFVQSFLNDSMHILNTAKSFGKFIYYCVIGMHFQVILIFGQVQTHFNAICS